MEEFNLIVIGAGPSGLSAAISASRNGLDKILVLDRLSAYGGMLTQCFHRGFGYAKYGKELTGPEYAAKLMKENTGRFEIRLDSFVTQISEDGIVTVATGGSIYKAMAKAVILATGCRERPIGTLPVYGTRPAGVYTAGCVQKMINLSGYKIGNRVVVLGSGDVGMIVSHHLIESGSQVIAVLEKEKHIGGLERNKRRYLEPHGIPLFTESTITRLHGHRRLEAVTACRVDDSGNGITETEYLISCDTLVSSVGLIPELELIRRLPVDFVEGFINSSGMFPSLPWLFVCGNARRVHSLVDSVTDEGARTGLAATDIVRACLPSPL